MSQEFDAIYERGVFRPLAPVDLPEQAKVHLQIHDVGHAGGPSMLEELAAQQVALRDLLGWIHNRPAPAGDESVSARDHDRILYGWQK